MDNYYNVLGVETFCTDQEKIKNAYRTQIKYFHPDLGNVSQEIAEEKTKLLNVAYDTLSDPQKKQIYDSQLRFEKSGGQQTSYSNSNYYNDASNSNYYSYSNNYRQNASSNYSYTQKKKKGKAWPWIVVALFLITMCSGGGTSSSSSYSNGSNGTSTNYNSKTSDQDANLIPESIYNGQILKYPSDERVAPLTIETSGSNGYYIYLDDITHGGVNDMAFYVKGGNTVDVEVPLGKYNFYYCTGSTWYGKTHKFGSKTSYCKADDIFDFYVSGDYVWGHTVTLYSVANGNLETENINESQFPG